MARRRKKKKILVTGAGGFIGSHLVKFLKKKNHFVRGVDLKYPEFTKTGADEFLIRDLRILNNCLEATRGMDEVYQLAADMGGMGFISKEQVASLYNSSLINTYMPEASFRNGVKKLFFSSSACVYPIHLQNTLKKNLIGEESAIPANPNEAYGWEKLVAEVRYLAYMESGKVQVRIARFENCYGPEGTFKGGREKAPAALCRKVALAKDGGNIEVWGDGKQTRSFMYIDDCLRGISKIMNSNYRLPINLGSNEVVSINHLAKLAIKVSKKKLGVKNVEGPQGVRSRYVDHKRAENILKWKTKTSLKKGIGLTYNWVKKQITSD